MSERPDPSWDETLAQSGHVRDAYRASTHTGTPSPDIDAAILAASKRHVNARPQGVKRDVLSRWRVPLSMAAVVMLASSLSLIFYQDQSHISVVMNEPVPAPAPAPAAPPAQADNRLAEREPALERRGRVPEASDVIRKQEPAKPKSHNGKDDVSANRLEGQRSDLSSPGGAARSNDLSQVPKEVWSSDTAADSATVERTPAYSVSAKSLMPERDSSSGGQAPAQAPRAVAAPGQREANARDAESKAEKTEQSRDQNAERLGDASKAVSPPQPSTAPNLKRSEESAAIGPSGRASDSPVPHVASPGADTELAQDKLTTALRKKRQFATPSTSENITPETWLIRIQQLWDSNKQAEATKEYREFLRKYPNFVVPTEFTVPKPKSDDE